MAEQQLVDYIRKSQAAGIAWDAVRQDLISAGWALGEIDEAYQAVHAPKPSVPVPSPVNDKKVVRKRYTSPYSVLIGLVLTISLLILAQNAITDLLDNFAPVESDFRNSAEYEEYLKDRTDRERELERQRPKLENYLDQDDYTRAYSGWYQNRTSYYEGSEFYNKYFSKYQAQTVSPSVRMILHAFIVLPFWIVTFLLSVSLREDRKRYGALLGAYYITSGWLLIFLFFNIAKYIYDSNSTLGVYVSFGMLALILTGAIWGIQRYRHSHEN